MRKEKAVDAEHDEALLRSAGADADAGADGGSPSIEAEEQAHLDEVLGAVRAAVDRARGLAERTEGSHREAGAQLAASRGELAPEEAHLSAYELNRMDAQAALAHRSRGRLEKLLDSPYFARVDFVEGEEGASSSAGSAEGETAAARQITYLGRFALTWENQALISDWRSPVAALFYDFEPGPAAFEAPAGRREGTLALKRQISIEEGQLRYAVDSSSSVRDEVLATVLGRTSDAKMHDIVSSIQREQNAVIRDEAPGTLIIQGVAGSGKTSIALHRVAYLLYRQKERLTSQSVAILSPSRVFSDYISGVLPELGEEPVRQWSLHDLAVLLLEGITKVAPPVSAADEADPVRAARAAAKGTEAFAASLTAWLGAQLGEKGSGDGKVAASELFEPRDLAVGGDVAEASWLAERFAAYAPVPFDERLDLIAGDALELAHGKTFGRYAHTMPTRRELRGRLLRMMRAKNPLALYKRFLADTGQSALFKAPAKGVVEWEDAVPVVLCALAFASPDGFAPHFCRAPSGHRRDAGSDAGAARGHLPPVPLRSHYPGGCEPARGRPCGVGARGGGGPLSGRAGGAAHDELPFDQRDRRAGRPGDARCGSRRRPAPWGGGALCALRRHRGGARGGERGHRAVACLWAAHLGSHREIGLPRRPLR